MSLPFRSEPTDELHERLPAALRDIYLYPNDGPGRPGTQRKHVFDTEHGVRFIISRGTLDEYGSDTFLHVSVSSKRGATMAFAIEVLHEVFQIGLSGELLGQSDGGVLHFKFSDRTPEDIVTTTETES